MEPDHCTLWFEGSWAHCCAAHDLAYADPETPRLVADLALAQCVAATGNGAMALAMLAGVVCFGWWFRKRAFRQAKAAARRPKNAESTKHSESEERRG